MSLLDGNSRFSKAPVNNISRSIFDRSSTLLTSFNAGKLVPIYVDEVLPGDTVTMDLSMLVRMGTPLFPVMDNAWIDVHWFFVPNRLLWDHWKNFMGESNDPWDSDVTYSIPTDDVMPTRAKLYDYFGLPVNSNNGVMTVSSLPRRAYQLIWNEWYRDQNLQDPVLIDKGDTGLNSVDSYNLDLLPVNKYHDYFTSCLPAPQKGSAVKIPNNGMAPVLGTDVFHDTKPYDLYVNYPFSAQKYLTVSPVTTLSNGTVGRIGIDFSSSVPEQFIPDYDSNLWADLDFSAGTINQLRQAFAVQRLLEADARGGTRYRELVKAHFGVDVGDSRVQVPEYLGGAHVPVNVMQVVQQSSTVDEPSPLGETGAVSKTVHSDSLFTKSFVEHGWILGLACVRTAHTYQNGINRMWSRKSRFDFYWPELANIGEQAVLNKEIYADGTEKDSEVFGYQEAWAEYRYRPNHVTGDLRSGNGLDAWHYADDYDSAPYLSDGWIRETDVNVARTLAVQDTDLSDQFLGDFYFKARWARPLPVYSIPGLTGHF